MCLCNVVCKLLAPRDEAFGPKRLARVREYAACAPPQPLLEANTDLATSDALALAREVDPHGERTLGGRPSDSRAKALRSAWTRRARSRDGVQTCCASLWGQLHLPTETPAAPQDL